MNTRALGSAASNAQVLNSKARPGSTAFTAHCGRSLRAARLLRGCCHRPRIWRSGRSGSRSRVLKAYLSSGLFAAPVPENGRILRHHALATTGVHIDASGSEFQDCLSGRGSPYEPSQAIVPEEVGFEIRKPLVTAESGQPHVSPRPLWFESRFGSATRSADRGAAAGRSSDRPFLVLGPKRSCAC